MKPIVWFRGLAVVLAIFTVGHTVGTRHSITNSAGESAVINSMQGYRVPAGMGIIKYPSC